MYGFVNSALEKLIRRRFGHDKWEEVIAEAYKNGMQRHMIGADNSFQVGVVYHESVTNQIIEAATEILGLDADTILEMFGEQFLLWCQESGYAKTLQLLGRSLKDFLTNLDALHDHLSIIYTNMNAPSFRCTEENGMLLLHYYSIRKLDSIVIGVVKSVGRELYNLEVDVSFVIRKGPEHDHSIFSIKEIGPCGDDVSCKEILVPGLAPVPFCRAVSITPEMFCAVFPFHIIFDENLDIIQVGHSLGVLLSYISNDSTKNLLTLFRQERPHFKPSFQAILNHINTIYVLCLIGQPRNANELRLMGQMIYMDDKANHMLFLCSPRIKSLDDLESNRMYISDIPIHDAMRALIIMEVEKEMIMGDMNMLQSTRKRLDEEMSKMKRLLNDILPVPAMEALMANQQVEAELFESVTILFSDIKDFTKIGQCCPPEDVVKMLNELYHLFDLIVGWNDVYKVETIGDAYMVVGGLPMRCNNHAERVCNQALDMIKYSQRVKNPVNGQSINIRVGIHSGNVVAGVVGHRMPRYCLFGDTVNVASRTESTGIPGRIQVTESTYKFLKDNPYFKFEFRGDMEFKNVSKPIPCYWLLEHIGRKLKEPALPDLPTPPPLPAIRINMLTSNFSHVPAYNYFHRIPNILIFSYFVIRIVFSVNIL